MLFGLSNVHAQKRQLEFIGDSILAAEFNHPETIIRIDSIFGRDDISGEFPNPNKEYFEPGYTNSGVIICYTIIGAKHTIYFRLDGCHFYGLKQNTVKIELKKMEGEWYEDQIRVISGCGALKFTGFPKLIYNE